jgi:hypothetical protein
MKRILLSIYNIIRDLVFSQKKIDKFKLPSQGLFYKNDFEISIKKASEEDIKQYEKDFVKNNLAVIIQKVKIIVESNTILSDGYIFEDLKSIDVVFIFLEIVKYTKSKNININYLDEENNKLSCIEFDQRYFNYYKIPEEIMDNYLLEDKSFKVNEYTYTLPSIGVENSLTFFLYQKSSRYDSHKYQNLFYDFTYFVGDKNFLTFEEIENLIQIFNFDIEKEEILKIKSVLDIFTPIQRYSLIKDGKEVDINSKIDLENIWK